MCVTPTRLFNKTVVERYGRGIDVPCGKCFRCRETKLNDWLFRFRYEAGRWPASCFVTFTFDDEHLPLDQYGRPTVADVNGEIALAFKRLRKNTGQNLKYFLVAEYGGRTRRPHYHCIVFGLAPRHFGAMKRAWRAGFSCVLPCYDGAMPYILKYMRKPQSSFVGKGGREFIRVSKGIGAEFLSEAKIAYHRRTVYCPFIRVSATIYKRMPKYYRERIFVEPELRQLASRAAIAYHDEQKLKIQRQMVRSRRMVGRVLSIADCVKIQDAAYRVEKKCYVAPDLL